MASADVSMNITVNRDKSPTGAALTHLEDSITDLQDVVSNLIHAIDPALGPVMPAPSDTSSESPRMETSEIVASIERQTDRIAALIGTVRSTAQRVEL